MNKQTILYWNIIFSATLIATTGINYAMEEGNHSEGSPLLELPNEIILHIGFPIPETNKSKDIIEAFGFTSKLMRLNKRFRGLFAGNQAFQNQVEKYKTLLAQADRCNKLGLSRAIRDNNIDQIKHWINNGANIDQIQYYSNKTLLETPLTSAVHSGNVDMVRVLLKNGAKTKGIINPLLAIRNYSNVEIPKLLIQYGADVNSVDLKGDTLLHIAVRLNDVKMFRFLLKHGANPELINRACETPYQTIGKYPQRKQITQLLEKHKNPQKKQGTSKRRKRD